MIKIGLLTPYSGIYPNYSHHFSTGLLLGAGKDPLRQKEIQFVPVYTQMGGSHHTEEAVKHLSFFENVDILSGLISYTAIPPLVSALEKRRGLNFFFDMGEYIPYFQHTSTSIFYISNQLWQSAYALGYWAQKEFGGTGLIVAPVYESGYHLDKAFRRGTIQAGSTEILLNVLPFNPQAPSEMDLGRFFEDVEKHKPAYVYALFSGNQGNKFLAEWAASKFYRHVPLLVSETMAYEDMLEDVQHLDLEVYSSLQWNRDSEERQNQVFVKQFEAVAKQQANIYSLLGYEAGMALKEIMPQLIKQDWDKARLLLMDECIRGPRGERNFYPESGFALPEIDIVKIRATNLKIHKTILDRGKGMLFSAPVFKEIHEECITGWQNPYLCV